MYCYRTRNLLVDANAFRSRSRYRPEATEDCMHSPSLARSSAATSISSVRMIMATEITNFSGKFPKRKESVFGGPQDTANDRVPEGSHEIRAALRLASAR